jgi:hypothetical protein
VSTKLTDRGREREPRRSGPRPSSPVLLSGMTQWPAHRPDAMTRPSVDRALSSVSRPSGQARAQGSTVRLSGHAQWRGAEAMPSGQTKQSDSPARYPGQALWSGRWSGQPPSAAVKPNSQTRRTSAANKPSSLGFSRIMVHGTVFKHTVMAPCSSTQSWLSIQGQWRGQHSS